MRPAAFDETRGLRERDKANTHLFPPVAIKGCMCSKAPVTSVLGAQRSRYLSHQQILPLRTGQDMGVVHKRLKAQIIGRCPIHDAHSFLPFLPGETSLTGLFSMKRRRDGDGVWGISRRDIHSMEPFISRRQSSSQFVLEWILSTFLPPISSFDSNSI